MKTKVKNMFDFMINRKGQRTAVIIPIKDYEEILEDLHDLALIASRKHESVIPYKQVRLKLKKDGKL